MPFVRDTDYPRVRTYRSVQRYRVHEIKGTITGGPNPFDFDCLEHFTVSDVAAYARDRETAPGRDAFRKQLFSFLRLAVPLEVKTIEE